MREVINELWHGNIIPQEDSRTNSKEMKEVLGYRERRKDLISLMAIINAACLSKPWEMECMKPLLLMLMKKGNDRRVNASCVFLHIIFHILVYSLRFVRVF